MGRQANTDKLNIEAAGIEPTRTGLKVDESLRTTNRKVYAIGDVAGGLQFTHVAGYHAGIIIKSMLFGLPSKARTHHIPWATYTAPELAQVGLTEAEARKTHGDRLEVVRFDFSGNDRAIATGQTQGTVKAMVVKGKPVGVSIVGARRGRADQLLGHGHRQRAENVQCRRHGRALSDHGRDQQARRRRLLLATSV